MEEFKQDGLDDGQRDFGVNGNEQMILAARQPARVVPDEVAMEGNARNNFDDRDAINAQLADVDNGDQAMHAEE